LEITTGKSTSNLGQDNAITLTATFDKAAKTGKQKALAINEVEFKDGTNTLGTVPATQNADGKWVATFAVNTKDWTVGAYKLTATFTGNHELSGITSNEVPFTQGEELNASNGFTFDNTSAEGIYKAGTGTITLAKVAGKYQFTFTNAVVASAALNAITLPTDAPVEVTLVGTSTISSTNTGADSSGIYISNGSNVTLLGDGTLTSAMNYTVHVNAANLTMQGGTVINTKEAGTTIFADGSNVTTAINGGTIENTTGNMAIESSGTVTVTGTPSIKGLVKDYRKDAGGTYNYLSFYGTAYALKGSLTTSNVIFMVNAGQTLTIPSGSVLAINMGRNPSYIQNNGTIQNEGAIIAEVKGNAVQGGGTVTKKAKMTFSLTDSKGKPLTNPTYGDTVTVTATLEKDTAALRAMQRAGSTPTFKLMLYKDSGIFAQLGEMIYTKDEKGVYTAKKDVKLDSIIKDYHDIALAAGTNYQFACEFSGDELLLKTKEKSEAFGIAQKELTISGLTPQNRVYDEYNPSVTLTGTAALEGIEAADKGNVALQNTSIIQGELENNYAGTGKKVTVPAASLYGAAVQNYSLNITLKETVDISRADNSIDNRSTTSKCYGESFHIEYSIVHTDTTQPTFTCEYKEKSAADSTYTTTLPTNVGNYTMRVSATETQNYNACSATQNFVIDKAPLGVTGGTAAPKKWDGTKTAT
ncbi:MAG: YDG domain-containing protein, partial [Angelakisella sp.]